ncbi:unnamed protein product [Cylindrotheca closterium]|uniref:Uncharacterized protein n=1 Tax=Cylindrotheca closterium TaxID=2856 RepID=A0AAD2FJ85_9STRA|nr:unnamed protein product [Cylindrotheca closterium]
MNLRTITTSAADVALALELIMPFGHGNRIPAQYIVDRSREIESETQLPVQSQLKVPPPIKGISDHNDDIVNEEIVVQLPVETTPMVVEETLIDDAPDDETDTNEVCTEAKQDLIEAEESPISNSDKSSFTTEEITPMAVEETPVVAVVEDASPDETDTSAASTETTQDLSDTEDSRSSVSINHKALSIESSDEPKTSTTVHADVRHTEDEVETQSAADEDDISIAESLDFTISVSMTDDEDDGSVEESGSDHLNTVQEDSVSIEVIPKMSVTENRKETGEVEQSEDKYAKSLIVNDSGTSLDEDTRSVSPSRVKPHIIDIPVEDGEEEYFQSTTSRDSFLIKLSLLGALNDVIYDDFVEQVCEYKALVMTLVKRYEVGLLREVEKPETKYFLKEYKAPVPKTVHQESEKQEWYRPEAKSVSLQQRKQMLQLEPLQLPDFSYMDELVKQSKAQIRASANAAKREIVQEDKTEEIADDVVISIVEEYEPIEPELGQLSFEMRDEDLEVREDAESREVEEIIDLDVESRNVEEVIDLVEPEMLEGPDHQNNVEPAVLEKFGQQNYTEPAVLEESQQQNVDEQNVDEPTTIEGSVQQTPKFRAVIEIVDDIENDSSTQEHLVSDPLPEKEIPSASSEENRENGEVRESARGPTLRSSAFTAFTVPKPEVTRRTGNRRPFASTTTMATIRAEVEAKYSKMARPTAPFDRNTLYFQSTTTPTRSSMPARSMPSTSPKPVTVTGAYKAPVVRVATAYAAMRRHQRVMPEWEMPEIINLVDVPEPMTE